MAIINFLLTMVTLTAAISFILLILTQFLEEYSDFCDTVLFFVKGLFVVTLVFIVAFAVVSCFYVRARYQVDFYNLMNLTTISVDDWFFLGGSLR
jgi:hypothetical protein